MKYWAFLSYSHRDAKWGDWLHKALETYRVPRRLIGQKSRDGTVPARVFPIFRDREELPVSADLSANINQALEASRYLVVICSPHSAQSRWVGEEITAFKRLGREDRILALIVDGEPNAGEGKEGFEIADECFHEAMRHRIASDGTRSLERTEPIAADARNDKDGKNSAKLKLLAGLLGVNYDDLRRREQERRFRRARLIGGAAVILVGIFALLSVALFFKQREARAQQRSAERARDEARTTLSRADFLQALRSIDDENELDALAELARSVTVDPGNQAAICRLVTLLTYRDYAAPVLRLENDSEVLSAQFSPDGKRIVTTSNEGKVVRVWSAETGHLISGPMTHDDFVWPRFSPDGKRIVTASHGGTVQVWDAESGTALFEPIKHATIVFSAEFSPDGKRIVTASDDNTAQIWHATTGKALIDPIRHAQGVRSARFSSDGHMIVTASHDGTARVWSADTGKPLTEPMRHDAGVDSAEFSSDGKRVLTASADKTARIWDATTGKALTEPMKHSEEVFMAHFSADSTRVVTACEDRTIRVWDAGTGKPIGRPIKHVSRIASVDFSPDGTRIVTASDDGTARVWSAANGKALGQPIKHNARVIVPEFDFDQHRSSREASTQVCSARFSPDGRYILTALSDGTARVWEADLPTAVAQVMIHDSPSVQSAEFSPDGKRILTDCEEHGARLWDAETGKALLDPIEAAATPGPLFSPDGKRILAASGNAVRIHDVETGRVLIGPINHDDYLHVAGFSPDGRKIVTASKNLVRLWDAETGNALSEPIKHGGTVRAAHISPDGKRIVIGGEDATARVWDLQTGKPLTQPMEHGADVDWAEFSPDGKGILTQEEDNKIRVWDAETGKALLGPIEDYTGVHSTYFSPDGKRIATVWGHTARLLDAKTGKMLTEPMNHDNGIYGVRFSSAGTRIVTSSSDNSARVWDAQTGKPLTKPMKHGSAVFTAQFSPDGKRVVTASTDRKARIWDIMPAGKTPPPWLPRIAEIVAREHLGEKGLLEPLSNDSAGMISELREQLNHDPAEDDWVVWGRWLLGNRSTRTISPFSKVIVPEYIEDRIRENTSESLAEAEQLALGNPQFLRRIATARAALPPVPDEDAIPP